MRRLNVVSTTHRSVVAVGTGVETVIPVTFQFDDAADLLVYRRSPAGTYTLQALGADYTVAGGEGLAGTVTLTAPIEATWKVLIIRYTPAVQPDRFPPGARLPAILERVLDRYAMMIQEATEISLRTPALDPVLTPPSEPYIIPAPSSTGYLRGRTDGLGWENAALVTSGVLGVPVPVADGGTGASDAPGARASLGLGTAALATTGTGPGQVPLLNGSGKLDTARIDTGATSGKIALVGAGDLLPEAIIPQRELWRPVGTFAPANPADNAWTVDLTAAGDIARVLITGAAPDTDNAFPRLRLGNSGGIITTSSYFFGVQGYTSTTARVATSEITAQSSIALWPIVATDGMETTSPLFDSALDITVRPAHRAGQYLVEWRVSWHAAGGFITRGVGWGAVNMTGPVTQLRVYLDTAGHKWVATGASGVLLRGDLTP